MGIQLSQRLWLRLTESLLRVRPKSGMWSIIEKIRMFNRLEEGGLGEAWGPVMPLLAPPGLFRRKNVRV